MFVLANRFHVDRLWGSMVGSTLTVLGAASLILHFQGVDLSKNIEAKRIAFVEGLPHSTLSTAVASLDVLENNITNTIASLQCRKVIVILDSPDLPLATGITTSAALNAVLLRIRSGNNVHSTVFCCSADLPLVSQSADQPLQTEHAAFVVQQAHLARLIISVRELETGAARDVSGVLRVTKGGACHDVEAEHVANVDEKEVLYLVGRDGSVKVFERGAEG